MSSSTLLRRNFANATITGHFGFVFEEILEREITWISMWHPRKAPLTKCFPKSVDNKHKAGVSKFLRFEERFRKAPFCDGLVWVVGLTLRNKAASSHFSYNYWRLKLRFAFLWLVVKYKKEEDSGLTNKIQKLSWHSVVKKGSRFNQRLTQLTGLVSQVNCNSAQAYKYFVYIPVLRKKPLSYRPTNNLSFYFIFLH